MVTLGGSLYSLAPVVVLALNAHGSSPYKLLTSKDPVADYSRVITAAFSVSGKARSKRPRAAALFQILQITFPMLAVAMGLASFLFPGEGGAAVSKRAADAAKAMKQTADCVAIASGLRRPRLQALWSRSRSQLLPPLRNTPFMLMSSEL